MLMLLCAHNTLGKFCQFPNMPYVFSKHQPYLMQQHGQKLRDSYRNSTPAVALVSYTIVLVQKQHRSSDKDHNIGVELLVHHQFFLQC